MKKLVFFFLLAAVSTLSQSYSIRTIDSAALLENRKPERPGETILLRSINTNRPFSAPRPIRHIRTSTETVDDGCVFSTWDGNGRWEAEDCKDGVIDTYWYGAVGDGITDDTAAFTAAANYIQQRGSGTLLAPLGTYKVSKIGPVIHFANISNVSISAESAVFTEADYVDSTWTSVTLTNLGTVATAVWASPHGFTPGKLFLVKDSTDVAFNGYWTVTHVDSPTQIRFNLTAYNVPVGAATALAHVSDTSHVLVRLDYCTNVNLGKIVFRGHALPVDNQFRLGWRVVEAFRGTTGVRGELDVEGAAYGFYSGEYENQSMSGCSDLRVKVVAKNVGYPVQATGLDDSAFEVVCDTVHRGGYFAGVRRSSANIWAKNWDIVGGLLAHQSDPADSRGCEDFTLRVWDTGTTVPQKLLAYGGYRHMASVAGYANTNAVKHKNLDIRVYGKNVPRGAGLIVQTYGTNHWIDGLKFGGNMDQSGLNYTNTGWPFFIYDTSPTTSGHYKNLVIEDFTWISTTNKGAYPGYLRLAQAENDVEFNRYSTDIYTSQGLPNGIHAVTVPRFPNWTAGSFESAAMQGLSGGIKLSGSRTIAYLDAALGTNDFTVQWVGSIPGGDSGLFVATTSGSGTATNASFGASVLGNGNLVVRAYGASASDYRGVYVTNWAHTLRGDIVSLGIAKTANGIDIYTDGHKSAAVEETAGIPPAWTDALAGVYVFIGNNTPGSTYTGTIYRFGVWDWDRSADFPALAIGWQSGLLKRGYSSSFAIGPTTENGSFETLGGGGADVFGSWTEAIAGTSTITVSTNAVNGTNSLVLNVDGSGSFAGITSGTIMEVGASYTISFWARVSSGGTAGQIALAGTASGDYPIAITDTWSQYFYTGVWGATTFSLKRWSLTSQSSEIDDIRIRKVGALIDYDWTRSPADQVNGKFSAVLGGTASQVVPRGLGISEDRGDNSANLEAGKDAPIQMWASAVTGARTVTLQTNDARRGDAFRIVRKGSGSGSLTLSTTPAVAVRTNHWVDVVFDGASWSLSGYGSLSAGSGSGWDSDALDGQDGSWYLARANHTGTQSYTTITGLGGLALINDAPSDGQVYGRSNATWSVITSSGGLTNIFPSLTNMLVAGANVTLAINTTNQTITISSSGGGGGATNGTSVSVNGGTALSVANINNTTGIAVNVSGTNVTFSIVDRDFGDLTVSSSGTVFTIDNGVINTNKIDATLYAWINNKPDLSDANVWTDANTFTKPIQVPSGGTGTNTHPAEALLVGNGTNVVKHLVASANKLAGWNGSSQVTNIGAGTGIAINDGVISATGTNAPQLGVNGSSVANPNLTNGPQLSPSVSSSNITIVINPNSIDTNKIDSNFYGLLMAPGGISDGDKGDITVSGSGATWTIDANSVALGTGTTGDYVATVAGTANEVAVSGSGEGAAVTISLPSTIDLGGKTSFELPNGASPTVDAFGELAGDNNAWATGRGAPSFFDGTSTIWLLGALASDTPTAGQVPKWNADGTITWEDDTGSASGFLPLTAGSSYPITGNLHVDHASDFRFVGRLIDQIGTDYYKAWGFRMFGPNFYIGTQNTNSFVWDESWIVFTPDMTGSGDDIITFSDNGFNNKVVFDADVEFNGTVTGGGSGDVVTTANNVLSGVNQFTNANGQVFSVPSRVLGGRINGWTASQMTPGTNAATQAQYKVLGDGIPTLEFDGTTSEEISMVGLLSQDPDRGSFVTITFASDDTANTVCWQAQWQLLTLRGIDTNLLSTAATWTSNIPGTARVPTNITFSLNAPTGLVGSTNDFSKPYMLRITRLPGSDSSLSNAYLIGVDHRYGL